MNRFACLVCSAVVLVPAVAQAQFEATETEAGEARAVDGRGFQYGTHLVSPIYVTPVQPSGASPAREPLTVDGGLGLEVRVGWELPLGFALELSGGFAINALADVDEELTDTFTRADVGVAARYRFSNGTFFVPFVELGGGARFHFFEWRDAHGQRLAAGDQDYATVAVKGAIGAQLELTPYFGIEFGCAVDYSVAGSLFAEALLSVVPFLGVTLYAHDESGH